jgi:hypothetical protein
MLGEYLELMKQFDDIMEIAFFDPETKQPHIFHSHKDLDQYVSTIQDKDFFKANQHDYWLLRMFDQLFWLEYHLTLEESKKQEFAPAPSGCPFHK